MSHTLYRPTSYYNLFQPPCYDAPRRWLRLSWPLDLCLLWPQPSWPGLNQWCWFACTSCVQNSSRSFHSPEVIVLKVWSLAHRPVQHLLWCVHPNVEESSQWACLGRTVLMVGLSGSGNWGGETGDKMLLCAPVVGPNAAQKAGRIRHRSYQGHFCTYRSVSLIVHTFSTGTAQLNIQAEFKHFESMNWITRWRMPKKHQRNCYRGRAPTW